MRISDWSSDVCSSDLAHAVDGPRAALRREVGRLRRVPVLGVDDERAGGAGRGDQLVHPRDDVVALGHVEAPAGVGEVVLHVDHHEGGPIVEALGSHLVSSVRGHRAVGPSTRTLQSGICYANTLTWVTTLPSR